MMRRIGPTPFGKLRVSGTDTRQNAKSRKRSQLLAVEQLGARVALSGAGTWTPLAHLMPDSGSDLPNGQVLYDQRSDSQLWLYSPAGGPSKNWQPKVLSVSHLSANTYLLTGQQLNGISEGASYGDDAEISTNYPIVTLTARNGTVYYARTFAWSNTSVQTGQARVTTRFSLPSKLPKGTYSLRVSASGIVSAPFTIHI